MTWYESTLDSASIDATREIIRYFGKFGDWSDIERIKELGERSKLITSLFDLTKTAYADEKAAAILSLGNSRVSDTLDLEMDHAIRVQMAKKYRKLLSQDFGMKS